jgi:hypothetical protein
MAFEFVQGVHLQRTDESVAEIDALAEACGGRAGIDGVLADLNRKARRSLLVPGLKVSGGLTWDRHDQWTRRWWPQGISTSAEAGVVRAQGRSTPAPGRPSSWCSPLPECSRSTWLWSAIVAE